MGNRTGTYVAFNGCNTTDPTESDLKYYALLKAWNKSNKYDFSFSDSHEKTYSVKDDSKIATLKSRLLARLKLSKNMLLIVTENSSWNRGILNWEIEKAVCEYDLPIIVAYAGYDSIAMPSKLSSRWPSSLKKLIDAQELKSVHIGFKQDLILQTIENFTVASPPKYVVTIIQ